MFRIMELSFSFQRHKNRRLLELRKFKKIDLKRIKVVNKNNFTSFIVLKIFTGTFIPADL